MFKAIAGLAQKSTLMLIITADGDNLRVNLSAANPNSEEKPVFRPLSLVASPEELDADFVNAIETWQTPKRSLIEQAAAAAAEPDEDDDAAQKTAAKPAVTAKKAAAKKADAKPAKPAKAAKPEKPAKSGTKKPGAAPAQQALNPGAPWPFPDPGTPVPDPTPTPAEPPTDAPAPADTSAPPDAGAAPPAADPPPPPESDAPSTEVSLDLF